MLSKPGPYREHTDVKTLINVIKIFYIEQKVQLRLNSAGIFPTDWPLKWLFDLLKHLFSGYRDFPPVINVHVHC